MGWFFTNESLSWYEMYVADVKSRPWLQRERKGGGEVLRRNGNAKRGRDSKAWTFNAFGKKKHGQKNIFKSHLKST